MTIDRVALERLVGDALRGCRRPYSEDITDQVFKDIYLHYRPQYEELASNGKVNSMIGKKVSELTGMKVTGRKGTPCPDSRHPITSYTKLESRGR